MSASSKTRELSYEEAAMLPAGADHYRAYVGPPDRFDLMGATQFALLFHLGLRENHRVLDFGCGSLRVGRLLIPFLRPERYFGIEPNSWLIEDAIKYELGNDIIRIKSPAFSYNEDFNCSVFGKKFDFILAQSIVTHAGPDIAEYFFTSIANSLTQNGIVLFTFRESNNSEGGIPENGWHYPHCVDYDSADISKLLRHAGLSVKALPWHHPGPASWHMAARTIEALPADEHLKQLRGSVISAPRLADNREAHKNR